MVSERVPMFIYTQEQLDIAVAAERERILNGVLNFYAVAPKAAEPMLRIIEHGWDGIHQREEQK